MAAPQKFRSALNGFNREDVVQYIQYISAKHETEVNQLRTENENLRSELAAAQEKSARTPAINVLATAQVGELTDKCDGLEAEKAALEEQLREVQAALTQAQDQNRQAAEEMEELKALVEQLTRERDEALAMQQEAQNRTEEELEAYRRAERTERLAQNRASQMYTMANGTLADTAVQLDSAAAALGQVAEETMNQIRALQDAVSGSKQVLADAAVKLGAICPQQEEI